MIPSHLISLQPLQSVTAAATATPAATVAPTAAAATATAAIPSQHRVGQQWTQ